jgi:pimeloyl-ACP methyl ester carboxylesterase
MAIYDVTDMSLLQTPTYTNLRSAASEYEVATICQVDVGRFFYDLLWERKGPHFVPIEQLSDDEATGIEVIVTRLALGGAEGDAQFEKWYEEEHVGMLSKVDGWLRTRLFKTSVIDESGQKTYLAYNEFSRTNRLNGPEHKASMSTTWALEVAKKHIATKTRRTYSLFYVFGRAPRDLESLAKRSTSREISAEGSRICENADSDTGALSSFITTCDGLCIPYRLEGNPDPRSPVVVFVNSLLTSLHMWDPFVLLLREKRPDLRILRYDARGRNQVPRPDAASLDNLAEDLHSLLATLRIPKLYALIGVSIGGATALKAAINYPDMIGKVIACDIGCSSPANAAQVWRERIDVAEESGGRGITTLATQTVSRWFHRKSMDDQSLVAWMTGMIAKNNVEGFKYSCTALWDYSLEDQLRLVRGPALLVAGSDDAFGAVRRDMDTFSGKVTERGAELKVVPNTGHLPMCENPFAFWEAVKGFL